MYIETEIQRKLSFKMQNGYGGDQDEYFKVKLLITVEPRYKEVGYNKTLLLQGNFAGPSALCFFVFLPWYNE